MSYKFTQRRSLWGVALASVDVFTEERVSCTVEYVTFPSYISLQMCKNKPNVVVEWLTLLLRIREILASNFGLEAGYLE
jgi:hypothetical protein